MTGKATLTASLDPSWTFRRPKRRHWWREELAVVSIPQDAHLTSCCSLSPSRIRAGLLATRGPRIRSRPRRAYPPAAEQRIRMSGFRADFICATAHGQPRCVLARTVNIEREQIFAIAQVTPAGVLSWSVIRRARVRRKGQRARELFDFSRVAGLIPKPLSTTVGIGPAPPWIRRCARQGLRCPSAGR